MLLFYRKFRQFGMDNMRGLVEKMNISREAARQLRGAV